MDHMLYISMSGAKEALLAQANNANNLANATTDGFKKDLNQFRAQHVEGPGWETRTYSMNERVATDFSSGVFKSTGRNLDVMVPGDGFLAIQSIDGTEALTRTASIQSLANGDLVNSSGDPILNQAGTPMNLPPYREVEVSSDGTISVVPVDSVDNILVQIDRMRLVQPDISQLRKEVDGYIRYQGDELEQNVNVTMISGGLESSNVNTAEALGNMVEYARKYEMQIKMMRTSKDNAESSDQILSLT
jgi:flagellar basal-body rod protein FlgF